MTSIQSSETIGGEFLFVNHGNNLQQIISEYIATTFKQQLPDLSQLIILVPAPDLIYTFRKVLLNYLSSQNINAIIGAEISPLKKWVDINIPLKNKPQNFINNHCRQLIILEALQDYPAHFENENLWQVSASLLQLFDELTLNNLNPSALNQSEWQDKVRQLYGVPNDPEHLGNEAQLIYTLWQAWQQQLNDEDLLDQTHVYSQRLACFSTEQIKDKFFIIAGVGKLTASEITLIKKLSENNPVRFFIQANKDDIKNPLHPDHYLLRTINALNFKHSYLDTHSDFDNTINSAFQHQLTLDQRLHLIEKKNPNKSINVFSAFSEDHESNAVDLQVRQWLLEGKSNIAIVTENRKLARRVRALLERSGVNLVDSVGWSLSTTNAASIVERWLESIEQDFSAMTFLDFLKSPFFNDKNNDINLLNYIFRFEQDIIFHEKITGNLQRYINALQLRKERLTHWESECYQHIHRLLQQINEVSSGLIKLYKSNTAVAASNYIKALLNSLSELGVDKQLLQHEAGERVLTEITHMLNACDTSDPKMNWFDFRTWLASAFENHHYSPSSAASHVRLLNLSQSNSGYYEGLIIASVEASQLPGSAPKTPFFNHHVRQSLGLTDWQQHKSEQYYLFRRLLQSADNTLISYCEEKNDEVQQPSPWLQTILDLYQGINDANLYPTKLYELLASDNTSVIAESEQALPGLTETTHPVISATDIPESFSSSRHQRLINCPYQFYANDILKLKAPEELILELQKSEYGQKVHKVLETYHLSKNPKTDFESSLKLLTEISEKIFKQDIEDNFLHRGWLKRWLDHCDNYLYWQQQHEKEWAFKNAEVDQKITLTKNIELKGRIDRVDSKQSGLGIIDYKTSSKTPSQEDVINGEDIQLSSYALLLDKTTKVEYLKLDEANGKVSSGASLQEDELLETTAQTRKRFTKLIEELKNNTPLLSNGADEICQYCNMSGLCRKDFWKLNE